MSRNFPLRAVLLALIPYMVLFGASFNYALFPILQTLHLVMLGIGLGAWLIGRVVGRWRWHPTAFDAVIWLWLAAITVAALANPDMIRRGQPALWFVTALLLGWYVLHDALTNSTISRAQLVDMILMTGFVLMGFAVEELFSPFALSDGFFGLPRVDGLTGNPNLLSALLVPIIGLAFGRAWSLRGIGRALLLVYTLVAILILALTYSRGAWLGAGAGFAVMVLAFAIDMGWTTPRGARAAWAAAKSWQRAAVAGFAIASIAGGAVVGVIVLNSLDDSGRTTELRTYLWEAAWDGFTEKPLTGNGLYSTPRIILDRSSSPPRSPQPHAHNFPLQVLSEMGILGAAALVGSIYVVLRWGIRAWRGAATKRERYLIAGGWAAAVGFGVHNLFDLAAWTPYVALAGLIALLVMTAPPVAVPYAPRKGRFGAWTAAAVALAVMVTGVYSLTQYKRYDELLTQAREPGQMLAAAAGLDELIARDPRQPVYRWSQAMLYAMEAQATGDETLTRQALAGFEEAGRLGMDSAVLRLNLAALNMTLGDADAARSNLERAAAYAPDSITLLANAALAAERWGFEATARDFWTRLLALPNLERSNVALMPVVAQSAIAADFTFPPPYQDAAAVPLLIAGQPDAVLALLDANPEWNSARTHALRALAHFLLGQDPTAAIDASQAIQRGGADWEWLNYAKWTVEGKGTPLYAIAPDPARLDYPDDDLSSIMVRLHFLRMTFTRLIVPQFGYDGRDYVLAALADAAAND